MEEIKLKNKNVFAENAQSYLDRGYSVIPDKYMSKMPAIRGWANYCYSLPSETEVNSWSTNITESGIALALGEASGVIAFDVDSTDQRILDAILPVLPPSPVTKIGSKGETRFFRYSGESTEVFKHNGEVVFEVLSNNKKTTLPPSIHPNGESYRWLDKGLLEVDKTSLPLLPPYLVTHLQDKIRNLIPDTEIQGRGKTFSGRNNSMSALTGQLIKEGVPLDSALSKMIEFDKNENDVALFTDSNEFMHTEPFTNALQFYANHLNTANSKHYRKNETYEIPITASAIKEDSLGKSNSGTGKVKKLSRVLPHAHGALKSIQSTILENSYIPQPDLAFSASLVLLGTLMSRKFTFQGVTSNLYILNIAPSGSGKDMPQQKVKEYLSLVGAENLLGAGDYVSDASLMDSLPVRPVRLDIMDEAGGILKTVNSGRQDYNGKMADILAELYTSSNSRYLGRATAEGTKGACNRPSVCILASTTPTGFSEGISIQAIEKGLMGRFLVFTGDSDKSAQRVRSTTQLDMDTKSLLRWINSYKPDESEDEINGIPQYATEIKASEAAESRLDEIFEIFDNKRRGMGDTDSRLPIVARLFQQMLKLVMIHAGSRTNAGEIPVVDVVDVEFGYKTILYYFDTISEIVKVHIHDGKMDATAKKFINYIRNASTITKSELVRSTRWLSKRDRDNYLSELSETGDIHVERREVSGRNQLVITWTGE
jgi:hypothetical protein